MLRDVGADKIKKMFRDAYALNGYADAAAIGAFVAVFTADLKEKQVTTISYDSASQATTVATQGGNGHAPRARLHARDVEPLVRQDRSAAARRRAD